MNTALSIGQSDLETLISHFHAHPNSSINPEMTLLHMMCGKHLQVNESAPLWTGALGALDNKIKTALKCILMLSCT